MRPITTGRPLGPAALRHTPAALLALAGLLVLGLLAPRAEAVPTRPTPTPPAATAWTGTWATAPTTVPAGDTTVFEDQTIRQVVHASVGGGAVRVRLTNEFGTTPLVIGEARIALRDTRAAGARTLRDTDRPLTFGGRPSTTIPAGAPALSDPVTLRVPAGADLVISLYLPHHTPGSTTHAFAFQHNYVADGNVTARQDIEATRTLDRWYFLSTVSVRTGPDAAAAPAPDRGAAVIALGDSITDGGNTTVNANHRWPDLLAERLRGSPRTAGIGVLNQGISGNRLLHDPNPPAGHPAEAYAAYFGHSALRRFDRDVAAQPGARYVVVLLGVNDLGHPGTVAPESERVTAEEIIAGHRQLIARAHERGLRVYGGTILPFAGDSLGFSSPQNEAARQQVNTWIRTSGEYDGVIDFDAALRDPGQPDRLDPRYDSGDGLHPNDAGARAMAQAVPLTLFQ
ncbi:SGNH/GDSL hydrolase family protein [Allostreptomyces psammosilenae]|uniref:Lysophospholipase L1-like esterase n=1 Tax=Allostreptomyces psammosilenae TaxID=1892865 RepID=A0A852ZRM4_9ACTN|nr:SGNH/GDSL hydrolase family protein [Allostreptomyces psammosilenae]NYI03930.1 lysophospholipase L1-like esterase [Allostreptomyces psammosilenae]